MSTHSRFPAGLLFVNFLAGSVCSFGQLIPSLGSRGEIQMIDVSSQFAYPNVGWHGGQFPTDLGAFVAPATPVVKAPPSAVSATQLRHPLTRKGQKLLDRIDSAIEAHRDEEARAGLKQALLDPSTAGYAHGILGSWSLQQGNFELAVGELRDAAVVLPTDVTIQANFGYALALSGKLPEGERRVRQALALNTNRAQTRLILAMILLAEGGSETEALEHIHVAERTLAEASLVLQRYYTLHPEKAAGAQASANVSAN